MSFQETSKLKFQNLIEFKFYPNVIWISCNFQNQKKNKKIKNKLLTNNITTIFNQKLLKIQIHTVSFEDILTFKFILNVKLSVFYRRVSRRRAPSKELSLNCH